LNRNENHKTAPQKGERDGAKIGLALKAAQPLILAQPSTIRLLEVLDHKGRAIAGARVKILVEGDAPPVAADLRDVIPFSGREGEGLRSAG